MSNPVDAAAALLSCGATGFRVSLQSYAVIGSGALLGGVTRMMLVGARLRCLLPAAPTLLLVDAEHHALACIRACLQPLLQPGPGPGCC